jgi:hypothetical protein
MKLLEIRAVGNSPIDLSDPDKKPGAYEREGAARDSYAQKIAKGSAEADKMAAKLGGTLKKHPPSQFISGDTPFWTISGLDFETKAGKKVRCSVDREPHHRRQALFFRNTFLKHPKGVQSHDNEAKRTIEALEREISSAHEAAFGKRALGTDFLYDANDTNYTLIGLSVGIPLMDSVKGVQFVKKVISLITKQF